MFNPKTDEEAYVCVTIANRRIAELEAALREAVYTIRCSYPPTVNAEQWKKDRDEFLRKVADVLDDV